MVEIVFFVVQLELGEENKNDKYFWGKPKPNQIFSVNLILSKCRKGNEAEVWLLMVSLLSVVNENVQVCSAGSLTTVVWILATSF